MKSDDSVPSENLLHEPTEFSLVQGGPLCQLLRRSHLSGDDLELMRLRIIVISLFAWMPLLVLSTLEGNALGTIAAMLGDAEPKSL